MINLLSPNAKKQLHSAHMNVLLFRYVIVFSITAVLMTGIFAGGYYLLRLEETAAENFSAQYEDEKKLYAEDMKKGEAFEKNLEITEAILANEVLFSDLLITIAKTLPEGSIISSFNETTDSLQKPMLLTIKTTSYDKVAQIKDIFEASPEFENVSINNVTQIISEEPQKYNTQASLNITITKKALTGGVER